MHISKMMMVATVLTVYGIETFFFTFDEVQGRCVATVLTVYGIETHNTHLGVPYILQVATVLTVYGIETHQRQIHCQKFQLQQYLSFTVLKQSYMLISRKF